MISGAPIRAHLASKINWEAIDRDGYSTLDLLSRRQCSQLRRLVRQTTRSMGPRFYASVAHGFGQDAAQFQREALDMVGDTLRQTVPDMEPFLASITAKGPRTPQPLPFHHDWTYTDERLFRTLFIWCPLVTTSPKNGTLQVVAGSHKWFEGIRPSREHEAAHNFQQALTQAAVAIPLKAGQAVAFNPAVLHGSPPNNSRRDRPAVTFALVDAGAPLLHFHQSSHGQLVGARVDKRFFTEHHYGAPPHGYPTVKPWGRAVEVADVERNLPADSDHSELSCS